MPEISFWGRFFFVKASIRVLYFAVLGFHGTHIPGICLDFQRLSHQTLPSPELYVGQTIFYKGQKYS